MLSELFDKERELINLFLKEVDIKKADELLALLAETKGIMIFSGVGKSGLVAEKIAVTMTSVGCRALYLSPTNALHGDIGFVSSQDIFIMLSKSGESDELLVLIPALRNKGVKIVSIVSNSDSRLAKACDFSMHLPVKEELCPFDMVPTTSTTIQMIFGDVLAVALMRQRRFSLEEYALNHPAGRIGKRISTKVSDLMVTGHQIPLCRPTDKLVDVLVELSNKKCGCILVVDPSHYLEGIFTDGDLRRSLQIHGAKSLELTLESLMTKKPRSISPEQLAWEAMKHMEADQKNAISVLPVLEKDNKVVGVIKLHDIVQSGI